MYCVQHAKIEELVPTPGVANGTSTCGVHRGAGVETTIVDLGIGPEAPTCVDCGATRHRAYFVVEQEPLCIRHAADVVFPDDDMGAHDMAHAAYIKLNLMGVTDAY